MEDPFDSGVASGWTYYWGGTFQGSSRVPSKETTIKLSGASSQELAGNAGNNAANHGLRQTLDATVGDAFTFGGWVWPNAAGQYNETTIRADWAGGTSAGTATVLSTWLPSGQQDQAWHEMPLASGNATGTDVTVFLHSRRNSSNGSLLTYWDDVVGYHAYVPPAPDVPDAAATATTLDVILGQGDNSSNSAAQFAITIGGGGYTLGTDWVQLGGSVGAGADWQLGSDWTNLKVLGLMPNTEYQFQVKARYSSTIAQETFLGIAGIGETTPEPATLVLLMLGAGMWGMRRHSPA